MNSTRIMFRNNIITSYNNLVFNNQSSIRHQLIDVILIFSFDDRNVKDVNVDGIPPPCMDECCCGATTQEHVHILVANKKGIQPVLRLHKPIGQEASRKLKNQVEIMQMMERS